MAVVVMVLGHIVGDLVAAGVEEILQHTAADV